MSHKFELVSKFEPKGDQVKAIKELTEGILSGKKSKSYLVRRVPGRPLLFHKLSRN